MALLSPPFLLGAAGQVMSGRLARLSLSAMFRPAASGVQVVSGVLAGPANTQGELALPSATQLTVQPFRAVVQSALDATAGSYEVINDAQVTLAVTAQHASQFRRSLVVVRVDDSQVSGVASSSTTDRATLEILDGALAASAGATVLPTPAGSWLALGEILIPPTGQTVTLTPYNPRTGTRHGILPVIADGSTVTGHDGTPGTAVGQYRDHPVYGAQRWNGSVWERAQPMVAGKCWCTINGNVTNGGYLVVQMGASRLFGGFTFNAPNNGVVIPVDGNYRITQHAYLYGTNGGTAMFLASRLRGSFVADLDSIMIYKASLDTQMGSTQQIVPLLAGDIVQQRVYGYSAGMSYAQNGEMTGCWIGAEYLSPLYGAPAF